MWTFDLKKTEGRILQLYQYYQLEHLQACEFACKYKNNCERSQRNDVKRQFGGGTAAVMPLYDAYYQEMPVRVLVIGKETGYMKNSEYGTSPDFQTNNQNVLNCIHWQKKNNHIKGTLYLLQNIFGVHTEYIYASYALSNLLRCSFQKAENFESLSGTRDTKTMRECCVQHLIEEIRVLQPTLIVTQGEWAIKGVPFVEVLKKQFGSYETIKKNSNGKYGLYQFAEFDCMTTHHPAILGNWIKNLAPDSVWPMLDILREMGRLPVIHSNADVEYERLAKPIVDPILKALPSNDLLRK